MIFDILAVIELGFTRLFVLVLATSTCNATESLLYFDVTVDRLGIGFSLVALAALSISYPSRKAYDFSICV